MNCFVWFFGPSGAGKAVTIKFLAKGKRHPLDKILPKGKRIVCQESIDWEGKYRSYRQTIPVLLGDKKFQNSIVLIKGQSFDMFSYNHIPTQLMKIYPHDKHILVFIWADLLTLKKHCHKRALKFLEAGNEEDYRHWEYHDCQDEMRDHIERFKKNIKDDFQLIVVDNSNDKPKLLAKIPE
jgi:hypothetical protein